VTKTDASKLGPIAATYAARSTCPVHCPFRAAGCYAGCNISIVGTWRRCWMTIRQLIGKLDELPDGAKLRWGIAGDLPGNGHRINLAALHALSVAVKRLNAWAYTHYLTPDSSSDVRSFVTQSWNGQTNLEGIREAQAAGFTINLSADGLSRADEMADLGVAPVATVLLRDVRRSVRTPKGRRVRVCPAVNHKTTCAKCGVCADGDPERVIVGFPAHGIQWKQVDAVARAS
jgi:hypothetical protein